MYIPVFLACPGFLAVILKKNGPPKFCLFQPAGTVCHENRLDEIKKKAASNFETRVPNCETERVLFQQENKMVRNGAEEEDGSVFPCEAGLEGTRMCRVCGLVLRESGNSGGSLGKEAEAIRGANQSTGRGGRS